MLCMLGVSLVFGGLAVANPGCLLLELWYTRSGKWIKPVTDEGKATLEDFKKELAAQRQRA